MLHILHWAKFIQCPRRNTGLYDFHGGWEPWLHCGDCNKWVTFTNANCTPRRHTIFMKLTYSEHPSLWLLLYQLQRRQKLDPPPCQRPPRSATQSKWKYAVFSQTAPVESWLHSANLRNLSQAYSKWRLSSDVAKHTIINTVGALAHRLNCNFVGTWNGICVAG